MRAMKYLTMKRFVTLLLVLAGLTATGQQYNNEWIKHNQTYYKFKVGKDGVYRISKAALDAAGIGNTSVEFFELWRNGELVPYYPSVPGGVLPANGFIEFWGKANDGKPDNAMYRDPAYQHSQAISLITDTAVYFLSVNTNQSGFRVFDGPNDVASNSLPVEPYFMYSANLNFKNRINAGFAAVVGEYVFSSSYDKGEFWSSSFVSPATTLTHTLNNLYVSSAGPATSTVKFGSAGCALNPRSVRLRVNGTVVLDSIMDYFNDLHTQVEIPTALISSSLATFQTNNTSPVSTDRLVMSYYELLYPREFKFGGQTNFQFSLPADNDGYYLEIADFSYGAVAPVLYDLTFGTRYVADITVPGLVRFVLPASTSETKFALVSQDPTNIANIAGLTQRTFIRFNDAANQGDYLIISHPNLYTGTHGNNPVDDYRAYRSSTAGGGYNVKVMEVEQLVDQFAFGIKNHPLSVRNFLSYAQAVYPSQIKNVFLIGRGMAYNESRIFETDPVTDRLNLVPTFGSPASDNMLASPDLLNPVPTLAIGRLSAVIGKEIEDYLEKVMEYEDAQLNSPNTLAGREWMKNVVHVTGASDQYLGTVLCNYMGVYKQLIEDTLFGGKVTTFCKTSTNPVEQLTTEKIQSLFTEGINMLTYFGHSSSTTLEFNLDNPNAYNNQGKYPVFFVNGCNAGNFFTYYPQRFSVNETLSEKFVLAKQRGSIAFVASTHFGIVNYLNLYLNNLYSIIGKTDYGKTIGETNRDALKGMMDATGMFDYYARMHAEEITVHGDPALRLSVQAKPDYIIEEPLIKLNPSFISIAEDSFQVKIKMVNIGKAIPDSVMVEVKQTYPDFSTGIIFKSKIRGIRYADSLTLNVPLIGTRDKGQNRITVTLDPELAIDEMAENNNSAFKDFFIFEDEARPVYPYTYAIVNDAAQKLFASTANPFSAQKSYLMEMDTTEKFNSSMKVSKTVTSIGGVLEFVPGISYLDSTVYYWRVSLVPVPGGDYHWNSSSFIYIAGPNDGFNQSHFFQHAKSDVTRIQIDSISRTWEYGLRVNNIFGRNAMYPTSGVNDDDFSISLNGNAIIRSACVGRSLVFSIIDPVTFKPWKNVDASNNNLFRFGSGPANCASGRLYNFEFSYMTAASRKLMMDMMDSVPTGHFVVVRSFDYHNNNSRSSTWAADTSLWGPNNSLYHKLLAAGFTQIDSINSPRCWVFIYKKGDNGFVPAFAFSQGLFDRVILNKDANTPDTVGIISSPKFGPAKAWKEVIWRGYSKEDPSEDNPTIDVIGIDGANNETVLYTIDKTTQNFDVSAVDANQFPYLRLRMRNLDSVTLTPYQLKYWRIYYSPVPEGAIAPNIHFTTRDTLELGETLNFSVAFKNISKTAFDSLRVKYIILDKNNVPHPFELPKHRAIVSGDSIVVRFNIETKDYPEHNIIFLDINPDNDQPEQYHYNNFLYRNFYVRVDKVNPLLDVTFDGVHILNRDIVSAKPHILIKLKDDAKFLLLNDTALTSIQVRYPDGTLRSFNFDNDTLRFVPAVTGQDNTATIDFYPQFMNQISADGDEYELIVKGKDRSGNKAGEIEYRVTFRVISKPMISNLLNYPNPFTTSTAFVFTITGSEIPSNIKIQILTVTGKIVREITKAELGPLHIGRNITEFKWDGTDQFGQRLANGVYLYRVVTTLHGKAMEKYKAEGDKTDQFFNNGYGKMYLMR